MFVVRFKCFIGDVTGSNHCDWFIDEILVYNFLGSGKYFVSRSRYKKIAGKHVHVT